MSNRLVEIESLSTLPLYPLEIEQGVISSVEYDSISQNSGGFGNLHKVISVNGTEVKGVLIKIPREIDKAEHALVSISTLHQKLRQKYPDERYVCQKLPQLKGLPFAVFRSQIDGQEGEVVAMLLLDLNDLGYEDFGSDSFNKEKFINSGIESRFYTAYQFTKVVAILHELNFIHSDLSENSIWINTRTENLVLIDYDSGYHIDTQDKPTTLGKIGQWIGSKFRKVIDDTDQKDSLSHEDRLNEENWVVANAVFELLFGVSPYFFLSDAFEKTKSQYLKKSNWPYANTQDSTFNLEVLSTYSIILEQIEQMTGQGLDFLIRSFEKVFNKGYKNEKLRLTSAQWMGLLNSICQDLSMEPRIDGFTASKTKITSSEDVVDFQWDVVRGNAIFLESKYYLTSVEKLKFNDSSSVVLKAENDFGESSRVIEIVAIKTPPHIKSFVSNEILRSSIEPIVLSWETTCATKVTITSIDGVLDKNGSTEVFPEKKTEYTLTAFGSFGEAVESTLSLDVIRPEIKRFYYDINIEKGIDNVDLHWETSDAISAEILPLIGDVNTNGTISRSIAERTIFKLTIKGLFSESHAEIEARPFPIPLIETVFIPTPDLKIDSLYLNLSVLDTNFVNLNPLVLDLNINLDQMDNSFVKIDSSLGKKLIDPPKANFFEDLFRNIFRTDSQI